MPTSKLRMFSSEDSGAPLLNGQTGSLTSLLDAVLVNGYGFKVPLGWTKPLANDSLTSSLGCWQQPSGSKFILYVNDSAPSPTTSAGGNTAWACGYESIIGLTGSYYPTTGTGFGVFPHYSQIFVSTANGTAPSSSIWWRKSVNNNLVPRPWILFGDSRTFYLFVQVGDTAGKYYTYWFGDIYSTRLTSDNYRCMIRGRVCDNADGSFYRFDASDLIVKPNSTGWRHFFSARSSGGGAFSCPLNIVGDQGKNTVFSLARPDGSAENQSDMEGIIPFPNPTDMKMLMCPLQVSEQSSGMIRGRLRGMYHMSHPGSSFTDGQEFTGAGEFAGKTFRCVKAGPSTGTFGTGTVWIIETSNTVETNPD